MDYRISRELIDWLRTVPSLLQSHYSYRLYEQLLFEWLSNDRRPIIASGRLLGEKLKCNHRRIYKTLYLLRQKGWIDFHQTYDQAWEIYWIRQGQSERKPQCERPGVRLRDLRTGQEIKVRIGEYRQAERRYGWRPRAISYAIKRWEEGKRSKLLEVLEICDGGRKNGY